MKKITLLILMLLVFDFGFGQTTLSAGDIAITGFNSDSPKQLSFVLLTDVLNGTQINFTDNGWVSSGGFRDNEGTIEWTASADLSCGTEIIITDNSPFSVTSGTITETNAGFNLSTAGDQILVYQGLDASPSFIYAINFDGAGWSSATTSNNTALPLGLTDAVNAVDVGEIDNAKYDCAAINDQYLILDGVSDSANWTLDTNLITLGDCLYTCSQCSGLTTTWEGLTSTWDNGTPSLSDNVILNGNYNTDPAANGNLLGCSLTVNSGYTLTVADASYVEIENDVIVDGTILVNPQGNFVQNDVSGTFTVNAGGIARVNKQTSTKAAWYYYTYWSSPVVGETIGSVFPDVDAGRRFLFNATNFVDTNGDDIDDNGDDWQYALAGDIMTPGVGFAITESQFFIPGGTGTASFEGEFNTGDIPVSIDLNLANLGFNWNFIGNPYPSAIDFVAFQSANSTIIDGAAYFWSQASPLDAANLGNEGLNFNLNDYATFTVGTGGTAGGVLGKEPTGYIASAQGFFIPALSSGTATFTNDMRMADDISNDQFFKEANTKESIKNSNSENKLWINLTSDNGVFNQILVGYVDGATNNDDGMSYDAPKLLAQDFAAALYTSMDGNNVKYVIQGKDINSIDKNEIIKLGFSTNINVATIYKLSISQFEGNFLTSNAVYVKDNLLNKIHDLSTSDYSFTSETGEFNERFEIVFNASALSLDETVLNTNKFSIVDLDNDSVQFNTNSNLNIKTISVFDLLGRQLYDLKGQTNSETYTLSNLNNTVYIAKIELSNGMVITKKAVKK